MALPLAATLTKAARQALPVIKAGVAEGLSSRAINTVLQNTFGKGIRRSVLLDIMRAETGIKRAGVALRYVNPLKVPDPKRLPQAITRLRRQYSFVVRVAGTLIDSGESFIKHITISTDELMSRAKLEEIAESLILDNQDSYGMAVDNVLLVEGVRAGELGVL